MRLQRRDVTAWPAGARLVWGADVFASVEAQRLHVLVNGEMRRVGTTATPFQQLAIGPGGGLLTAPHRYSVGADLLEEGDHLVAAATADLDAGPGVAYSVRCAAWDEAGELLVVVVVQRPPRGHVPATPPTGVDQRVAAIALDGAILGVADGAPEGIPVSAVSVTTDAILTAGADFRIHDRAMLLHVVVPLPAHGSRLAPRPGAVAVGCNDGVVVMADHGGVTAAWDAHRTAVADLAWFPRASLLATVGDERLRVWDEDGGLVAETSTDGVARAIAVSADGTRVAVSVGGRVGATVTYDVRP